MLRSFLQEICTAGALLNYFAKKLSVVGPCRLPFTLVLPLNSRVCKYVFVSANILMALAIANPERHFRDFFVAVDLFSVYTVLLEKCILKWHPNAAIAENNGIRPRTATQLLRRHGRAQRMPRLGNREKHSEQMYLVGMEQQQRTSERLA